MNFIWVTIAGALAGWIAEKIMKFDTGLIMNIVLGIVGANLFSFVLSRVVPVITGMPFVDYVIEGVIGACVLIYAYRAFQSRSA